MKFKKENWETTRKKGFLNFLVIRGFLLFGLPFTVIQLLFNLQPEKEIKFLPLIVSGIIGSLIYSSSLWYFAERKFKKEDSTNKP